MGTCPDAVKRLIDRFRQQSDHIRSPDYNETLIRVDFINPLMDALGWDIDNRQGFAEQYREVVHEDRVKVAGQTKAPDYSFRVGGSRKFFLEAKKPAVDIKNNWEPAYQLRRYAWSAKLCVSLLTDFEEFAVYDARLQPSTSATPADLRRPPDSRSIPHSSVGQSHPRAPASPANAPPPPQLARASCSRAVDCVPVPRSRGPALSSRR